MGEWSNGLFGCFNNCGICIITYFVPCVTAGQVAESVGKSCCLHGFLSMLGCIGIYFMAKTREEIRVAHNIEVSTTHAEVEGKVRRVTEIRIRSILF